MFYVRLFLNRQGEEEGVWVKGGIRGEKSTDLAVDSTATRVLLRKGGLNIQFPSRVQSKVGVSQESPSSSHQISLFTLQNLLSLRTIQNNPHRNNRQPRDCTLDLLCERNLVSGGDQDLLLGSVAA